MNEAKTITKEQLISALAKWEQDYRDGKCLTHEEADAQTVEENAKMAADDLWDSL
jgi:predicted transcriptional regulator